jgi:hypothetical protein
MLIVLHPSPLEQQGEPKTVSEIIEKASKSLHALEPQISSNYCL